MQHLRLVGKLVVEGLATGALTFVSRPKIFAARAALLTFYVSPSRSRLDSTADLFKLLCTFDSQMKILYSRQVNTIEM